MGGTGWGQGDRWGDRGTGDGVIGGGDREDKWWGRQVGGTGGQVMGRQMGGQGGQVEGQGGTGDG